MDRDKLIRLLVKAFVADHFMHLMKTIDVTQMRRYEEDTLNRVYEYISTGNTAGFWSDLQCNVSLEIAQTLKNLYPEMERGQA